MDAHSRFPGGPTAALAADIGAGRGIVAASVPKVHLSRMLFVPNPYRARRSRGLGAAATVLVLATAPIGVTGAAAQDPSGFEALRAGRYDEAVRTLRAQALDGNAAALSGWVTALRETGDYEGAIEAAERGWSGGWRVRGL